MIIILNRLLRSGCVTADGEQDMCIAPPAAGPAVAVLMKENEMKNSSTINLCLILCFYLPSCRLRLRSAMLSCCRLVNDSSHHRSRRGAGSPLITIKIFF